MSVTHVNRMSVSASERMVALAYVAFIAAFSVWIVLRPIPRWDLLGYAAAALSWETQDAQTIHKKAYDNVRAHLSPEQYQKLAASEPYRRDMARDARLYAQQIPFYSIRPLYVLPLYLLHKSGVDFVHSATLVSALSYFAIGLLLFRWLRRYTGAGYGAVLAGLLMISTPIIMSAKLMTPDLMSAALMVGAMYALLEHRAQNPFALLMLAAVYVRPDNLLLVAPILLYLHWFGPLDLHISGARLISLLTIFVASYIGINAFGHHYSWSTLFYHTFIEQVSNPADRSFHIGVNEYLYALKTRGGSIFATSIVAFLFAGACAYYLRSAAKHTPARDIYQGLILIVVTNIVLRFILFPVLWDRMFIAHYVLLGVLFVLSVQRHTAARLTPQPTERATAPTMIASARKRAV